MFLLFLIFLFLFSRNPFCRQLNRDSKAIVDVCHSVYQVTMMPNAEDRLMGSWSCRQGPFFLSSANTFWWLGSPRLKADPKSFWRFRFEAAMNLVTWVWRKTGGLRILSKNIMVHSSWIQLDTFIYFCDIHLDREMLAMLLCWNWPSSIRKLRPVRRCLPLAEIGYAAVDFFWSRRRWWTVYTCHCQMLSSGCSFMWAWVNIYWLVAIFGSIPFYLKVGGQEISWCNYPILFLQIPIVVVPADRLISWQRTCPWVMVQTMAWPVPSNFEDLKRCRRRVLDLFHLSTVPSAMRSGKCQFRPAQIPAAIWPFCSRTESSCCLKAGSGQVNSCWKMDPIFLVHFQLHFVVMHFKLGSILQQIWRPWPLKTWGQKGVEPTVLLCANFSDANRVPIKSVPRSWRLWGACRFSGEQNWYTKHKTRCYKGNCSNSFRFIFKKSEPESVSNRFFFSFSMLQSWQFSVAGHPASARGSETPGPPGRRELVFFWNTDSLAELSIFESSIFFVFRKFSLLRLPGWELWSSGGTALFFLFELLWCFRHLEMVPHCNHMQSVMFPTGCWTWIQIRWYIAWWGEIVVTRHQFHLPGEKCRAMLWWIGL